MLFHRLPFCEQLLIWAARKWAETPEYDGALHKTLQTAFRLAKAPEAYLALDGFLTVLFVTTTRTIDFRSHKSQDISADEDRFLAVVAALQVPGNRTAAKTLLAAWLPKAAQRIAFEQCEFLARDLALANHHLSPREARALSTSTSSFKRQFLMR